MVMDFNFQDLYHSISNKNDEEIQYVEIYIHLLMKIDDGFLHLKQKLFGWWFGT
jgi:hypothetical protein